MVKETIQEGKIADSYLGLNEGIEHILNSLKS
jgi:hypothetical protein